MQCVDYVSTVRFTQISRMSCHLSAISLINPNVPDGCLTRTHRDSLACYTALLALSSPPSRPRCTEHILDNSAYKALTKCSVSRMMYSL